MRRSHVISLFVMFAAVSVFVIVMAFLGRSPESIISSPTATNRVVELPSGTPPQTSGALKPEPTEAPTDEPTAEPTEEPTPTPVVRPEIDPSDFSHLSTKAYEWSIYGTAKTEGDPETIEYTIDSGALKAADGYEYIYRITGGPEKTVYLTFNLGFEDKTKPTLTILEKLKANDVKAVFFIAKNYFEENPEIVREIIDRGHIVGTRGDIFASGYGGTGMPYLSTEDFSDRMWEIEELYRKIAEKDTRMIFYRPSAFSSRDMALAEAMGYKVVFKTYDYYDWDEDVVDRNKALSQLLKNTRSGIILQLSSSKVNAEILTDYIVAVKDRGYTFGVPEQ